MEYIVLINIAICLFAIACGVTFLTKGNNTDEALKRYIKSVYKNILGFNLGLEPSQTILELVRKKKREQGIRLLCVGIFGLMVLSLLINIK